MTQTDPTTDRLPMPPAEFLAAVTMVGERAAAGYGWQEGYLAGRAAAAADIRAEVAANPNLQIWDEDAIDVVDYCARIAEGGGPNADRPYR